MKDTSFKLNHGDAITGMEKLAARSVDVAVTSPPYNLGVRYSRYVDQRADYLDWSLRWAAGVRRVLRDDVGALFLVVGGSPSESLWPHRLALAFCDSGLFVLQNTFHWIKAVTITTPDGKEVSAGHFKPVNSSRFVNDCHEYVFHFTKIGRVPIQRRAVGVEYVDKSNIGRWIHNGTQRQLAGGGRGECEELPMVRRCRGNTWFVPYETIQSRARERPHPATFPVALAERCLRLHGVSGESTVLDPFLGIGSSALAARRCGAGRFIGFEMDASYLEIARERLGLPKDPATGCEAA